MKKLSGIRAVCVFRWLIARNVALVRIYVLRRIIIQYKPDEISACMHSMCAFDARNGAGVREYKSISAVIIYYISVVSPSRKEKQDISCSQLISQWRKRIESAANINYKSTQK